MLGLVLEKKSDKFEVECKSQTYLAFSRKNLKKQGIYVGDYVEYNAEENIIESVIQRKNLLLRPNIANIQVLFVVISHVPKPDFFIVDKLLLFCFVNKITPIIVVNKIDLIDECFRKEVEKEYKNVCEILFISAKTGQNVEQLHKLMKGNICAFAGQSAVGKSALINKIYNKHIALEGLLSKKIMRGKNTTSSSKLYKLENQTYVSDTAGFSSLDEKYLPINYFELCYYYPDFLKFHELCKYKSCTHTKEDGCGVKNAVIVNKLSSSRYDRYAKIFDILKKEWTKTHG